MNMSFSTVSSGAKLDQYNGTQTKINVPETFGGADVTTIGATAFNDPAIEMIYLPITTTTVEENAFLNCGDDVIVILELSDPLADVPKDVAKWGMGDYTAEIRYFTDTGRTDLFIVKGEIVEEDTIIRPEDVTDCSNIKQGKMTDLIFESNLDNDISYTGITYTKDKIPPEDAYDISLRKYDCSRGQEMCVQMWAEETEIYITFCGEEVYLEDGVTNYYTSTCGIHSLSKDSLSQITHITGLGYVNTTKVTSMNHMFCQYSNNNPQITELDLSNFYTPNVISMQRMFGEMAALEDLDLSSFDTSNVYDMSQMFLNVSSLRHLDLSMFDTSSLRTMAAMFGGMNNLVSIDLSTFDTSKVYSLDGAFANVTNLKSIDLSGFDTSNVSTMTNLFKGAKALTTLDLSSFVTDGITPTYRRTSMFANMDSLKTLYVHDEQSKDLFVEDVTELSSSVNVKVGSPTP